MNRREIERMLDALARARAAGQQAALATVVRIRGSAYRREGARIVVLENGTYECLLSGGCLEPTVADAAQRVIQSGHAETCEYDLADDSVWGLSIGCSGAVDIRIERVNDDALTNAWLAALTHGERAVLIAELATNSSGPGRLLIRSDGTTVGSLSNAALQAKAVNRARARLAVPGGHDGIEIVDGAEVFVEVSEPPPSLVIFGAGPDAEPLARHAWELGFTVAVVDVREAFLTAERFPNARLVASHFSAFADRVPLDDRSFVVVMNHHIERDQESLRYAVSSPAPYIGLLGPRSRYERLMAGLASQYGAAWAPGPAALARIHSPVGLALGAEAPEEIAVSILGEILAFQRGFEGGFLTGQVESLHESREGRGSVVR